MTVIIGIAIINLMLGFAAALLLGRGPQRWSDVERAIVLQPIALGHLRPDARPTVERVYLNLAPSRTIEEPEPEPRGSGAPNLPAAATNGPSATSDTPSASNAPSPPEPTAGKTAKVVTRAGNGVELLAATDTPPEQTNPPLSSSAQETAPKEIVLTLSNPVVEAESQSPEKTLSHQLDTWRHSDLSDEAPSMSGIKIDLSDCELDDATSDRLLEKVFVRIKSQVRKDRRVLKVEKGQFAWFSCDVTPDDALMPIERIRQILTKTRFFPLDNPLPVAVVASVVIGQQEDDAEELFKRLHMALQHASEDQAHATYLDTGNGPESVEPYEIEVEETECEL